jgi:hypothetical protein
MARIQRRLRVDHGGEEFGPHELVDSLETPAFPALTGAGGTLVIQQGFQIISQFVHGS